HGGAAVEEAPARGQRQRDAQPDERAHDVGGVGADQRVEGARVGAGGHGEAVLDQPQPLVALDAEEQRAEDGGGRQPAHQPPPVGGGGGGVRPLMRRGTGRGGASRTSGLTSESPPGTRRRRGRPRPRAARGARDGYARRARRPSARSYLVEGQEREERRQVE